MAPDADATAGPPQGWHDLEAVLAEEPVATLLAAYLVVAQCTAGVVGSMPALNARPAEQLNDWLAEIRDRLAAHDARHSETPAAPFALNLIVHRSNDRLQ